MDYRDRFRQLSLQQIQQIFAVLCEGLWSYAPEITMKIDAYLDSAHGRVVLPDNRTWDQIYAGKQATPQPPVAPSEDKPLTERLKPYCKHVIAYHGERMPMNTMDSTDRLYAAGSLVEIVELGDSPTNDHAIGTRFRVVDSPGAGLGTLVRSVRLVEEAPSEYQKQEPTQPDGDPDIIHAAEGVVLEPGEYEIIAVAPKPMVKSYGEGQTFRVDVAEGLTANAAGEWSVVIGEFRWRVTAVRRVEAKAQPEAKCERCGGSGRFEAYQCDFECPNCKGTGSAKLDDKDALPELMTEYAKALAASNNALLADMVRRASDPAPTPSEERAHVVDVPNHYGRPTAVAEPFPAGTPEAIRDALLRNCIFDCIEKAGPKTVWHYHHALELITAYRLELTKERDEALARVKELEAGRASIWEKGYNAGYSLRERRQAEGWGVPDEANPFEALPAQGIGGKNG